MVMTFEMIRMTGGIKINCCPDTSYFNFDMSDIWTLVALRILHDTPEKLNNM